MSVEPCGTCEDLQGEIDELTQRRDELIDEVEELKKVIDSEVYDIRRACDGLMNLI